jgi:hypothetical protein
MTHMIIFPLVVLSIGKVYPLHDLRQGPAFFLCLQNQMNMVLHQDIMVKFKMILLFILIKDLTILFIVGLIPEDILAVVPAAKNVKYMIPGGYPRSSRHFPILPILIFHVNKIEPSPFTLLLHF